MRILRGLTSRVLSCGCMAGIYETYDGRIVTLLDERDAACQDRTHLEGERLPEPAPSTSSEVTLQTDRQRQS
jgi:hypothetical protein